MGSNGYSLSLAPLSPAVRRNMKIATVIALCVLLTPTIVGANDVLSELESRISSEGSRAVLIDIWNTDNFGAVLDGIASGDERWLIVGYRLRNESDAGVTSMLRESFAMALIPAPSLVLKTQKEGRLKYSVEELCGSPFIDEPQIGFATFFSKALLSVRGIKDKDLEGIKQRCLEELQKGRELYIKAPNQALQPTSALSRRLG